MTELYTEFVENSLFFQLSEIFPEACPNYLRRLCYGKIHTPIVVNEVISKILEEDYPKRPKLLSPKKINDIDHQLDLVQQILPDADPNYLKKNCMRFVNNPEGLKKFVSNLVETSEYPTKKDYLIKRSLASQRRFYTTEFNLTEYLKVIPDPEKHFKNIKRSVNQLDEGSRLYVFNFLSNCFPRIARFIIRTTLEKCKYNTLHTYDTLQNVEPEMLLSSIRRPCALLLQKVQNIEILQEIAFIKHRAEIEEAVFERKNREENQRKQAKQSGILQTCGCCFDDEVLPIDIYECERGCIFCKDCIRKGAEVAYGLGKLEFPCLNDCTSFFSLQTLQAVLIPNMFSRIIQKKQIQEIKAAGMEDLEMCPFCEFAIVPSKEDKVFRCLNPECMKETCRLCKEPSHIPLRCDEVEKQEDVALRTYIEDKMTEALLRKCYKCGLKFVKASGCNKMTCSCGAYMCYVCGKPVQDYKHFNGPGGDQFNLCPLYSDTNQLHEEAVLRGAELAKREKGLDLEPSKLKMDPTVNVREYYKKLSKRNPINVPPPAGFPFVVNIADYLMDNQRIDHLGNLFGQLQRIQQQFPNPNRHN